ncbi:MAG TPA: M24 family metallopeptidase [Acidobacteriota bacterium]|nr:M24 family metallopeptidase [Acidobacteriota bacterium]
MTVPITFPLEDMRAALQEDNLDGWLLYDFRGSNAIARNIVQMPHGKIATRRWFYFIHSKLNPVKLVHAIEHENLDHLPGQTIVFRSWQDLHAALSKALNGCTRIAMEYSPEDDIPYVSLVDAGVIELVRKCGVEIVSSGDLVQLFEARWDADQSRSHFEAARLVNEFKDEGFRFIGENIRAGRPITEYDVQQHMWSLFEPSNMYANDAPIVAVNANASNPHYLPTAEKNTPVRKGDLVLIDIWGKLRQPRAIYGDITWMGYAGHQVPERFEEIFQIVRGAQQSAFELITRDFQNAKTTFGWQADQAARDYIAQAGYGDYFYHRTGHNIGQEVHGNGAHLDNLETRDNRKLIPNTGFSIEPGIYLPEFGVRSEVDCYISEKGPVITSPRQEKILALLA